VHPVVKSGDSITKKIDQWISSRNLIGQGEKIAAKRISRIFKDFKDFPAQSSAAVQHSIGALQILVLSPKTRQILCY